MKKTQEQLFLQVKQRLDYYQLPTIFPYQAVDLLSRILALLDKQGRRNGKENNESNKIQPNNQINDALRHEIGKVVKQNNRLHMELISNKQEIIALKHSKDKLLIQRVGGSKQMTLLLQAQRKREDQLFEQLTQVKYKYNELMDLVHEDSEVQKKYLKRLMKHKKMEINEQSDDPQQKSFKKGPHHTVTDLEARVILLQNKVANREAEIMRLQKRSEYDGLNMNKILKDFQNNRTETKVQALEQQINYLEEQNKKMKQEVNYCRKNGGSKEALREQMRKNHQTINTLSHQNKELKRKIKQKQFDGYALTKEGKRQVHKAHETAQRQADQTQLAKLTIADLKKKVQFLQGQADAAKISLKKQQVQNNQKDILLDKLKNSEEGDKILAQYEVQNLKQKAEQLETELENYLQRINELKAENQYHKKQDKLKNEAIQNLQKIVDELMRRNQKSGEIYSGQSQSVSLQNTIALRKNLAELKQSLAICQNEKQKLERDFQTLMIRFDKKSQQSNSLNEQMNRIKIKLLDLKHQQQIFNSNQRQFLTIQSDLKKQQNLRYKIDQLHQDSENDKAKLRKQLQQLSQQYQIYEKKSKNHINTLKIQINELQEGNQMLDLILKQKQKKILINQSQIQQLNGKVKLLKDEIKILEQEKLTAIRQKHKYEKRCQDMLKMKDDNNHQNLQLHNGILQYQKQIQKLRERISHQNQQILQLNSLCDALKMAEDNLAQQKTIIKKEMTKLKQNPHKNDKFEQQQEEDEQEEEEEEA